MKPLLTTLITLCSALWLQAQVPSATHLQCEQIKGGHLFERNLHFAGFSTKTLRRNLGSYTRLRSIVPANLLRIEGIPLYHKEKTRSKDKFRFDIMSNGVPVARVEIDAVLLQNETFHLFKKQDSSFFGTANTDLFLGSISVHQDSATTWDMAAWNLNGSKNELQRGMVTNGKVEITFEQTTMLLRDAGDQQGIDTMFRSLHQVYAFRCNNRIIAAVAFKDMDRLCWIDTHLNNETRIAVAGAMAALRLRRDIYR